jgi:hypothetical protein
MKKVTKKIVLALSMPIPKINIAMDEIFAIVGIITFLIATLYVMF